MKELGLISLVLVGVVLVVTLLGCCWNYSINTVRFHLDKDPAPAWIGFALAIIPGVGQVAIPLFVVAFIANIIIS